MANHILLLGAGFSHNWGGLLANEAFEYLLGCPTVVGRKSLRDLLWHCQFNGGGFEDALCEVSKRYTLTSSADALADLRGLQDAVELMFAEMNADFLRQYDWDTAKVGMRITEFLARFDAIFTLNQDLLLENFYCGNNASELGLMRLSGSDLPGVSKTHAATPLNLDSWAKASWMPQPIDKHFVKPGTQPIFKMHGSCNWTYPDGRQLLIVGGAKVAQIDAVPLLNWYAREFDERLCEPDTRLMVIGYGFRDPHINVAIERAVAKGLKLFIIAPEGAEIARRQNSTRAANAIAKATPLEEMIEQSLIGASRRPLRSTFNTDAMEHGKVMRFFRI
jgi:hypothetical protein